MKFVLKENEHLFVTYVFDHERLEAPVEKARNCMFNLEKFYELCGSGEIVDSNEVIQYIRTFKNVILWGASFQGAALGKYLLEHGVPVTLYWDMRSEELKEVNGIKVTQPFEEVYDGKETVIIYCIPNHVIMKRLLKEIDDNKYKNVIRGDILYSGTVCRFNNNTMLTADRCWGTRECRSVICKRASTIVKNHTRVKKPGSRIDLTYSAFIINSICNLSCKHCVQYVNNYPVARRGNVPYEVVAHDVDAFLGAVDSIGTIAVMGGETFMHPDIGRIVERFSAHKNFGFLSLPTNGLHPIRPGQLERIKDPRIVVSFGYYLHVADERQKSIYLKNVDLVRSRGIPYTESVQLPVWIIPSEIAKLDVDEALMTDAKSNCPMPPRNLQVRYGKVHVCDKSVAVHAIGLADYPTDYVDLTKEETLAERRQALRDLIARPFYYTCGHCYGTGLSVPSAMQGVRDVFKPNNSRVYKGQ